MKRLFPLLVLTSYFLLPLPPAAAQTSQRERLQQHVYTLAADSLNGRQAGSDDAARARAYIARQWREMGLKPFFGDQYEMPFDVYGQPGYCNLVAVVEGSDPVLKGEYIVIGGHYDHLGVKNGEVYNGADDNASGTACVTEVARQLLKRREEMGRSVVICAFDAEEMGLYGSGALARKMEGEGMIDRVKLMMSVDMVGWLKQGGALTLQGTGTLSSPALLTDAASLGIDIKIRRKGFENSILTATDTEPFAKLGIATLAVTTGLKSPYHKPGDDAELIDYEGLDRVTDYIAAFTVRASQQADGLASGKVAAKHRKSQKKFEVGLAAGANTGRVTLTDAAVTPKRLIGWTGGLTMQYNFNNTWALYSQVAYTFTRNSMPMADDAYGKGYRMRQESVTVPLALQVSAYTPGLSTYFRLGGYFNYLFYSGMYGMDGDDPAGMPDFEVPTPYRGGLTFGFGFRVSQISLNLDFYHQFGKLFDTSAGLPDAHGSNFTATLGWWF